MTKQKLLNIRTLGLSILLSGLTTFFSKFILSCSGRGSPFSFDNFRGEVNVPFLALDVLFWFIAFCVLMTIWGRKRVTGILIALILFLLFSFFIGFHNRYICIT